MPQNTLVPAVLSASLALWLLLGTFQVGKLTNSCCPSLPSCFATAHSDTAVPTFASGLVGSYQLHCSLKYSEYY